MTKREAKEMIVDKAIDREGGKRRWERMSHDERVTAVEAALWRYITHAVPIAESVTTADIRAVWNAAFDAAGFND